MLETCRTLFQRLLVVEKIEGFGHAEPATAWQSEATQEIIRDVEDAGGLGAKQPLMRSRRQVIHAQPLPTDRQRPQRLHGIDAAEDAAFVAVARNGGNVVAIARGELDKA